MQNYKNYKKNIRLINGSLTEEYPEQLMSFRFLYLGSKVLEIGGNIGINSIIAYISM